MRDLLKAYKCFPAQFCTSANPFHCYFSRWLTGVSLPSQLPLISLHPSSSTIAAVTFSLIAPSSSPALQVSQKSPVHTGFVPTSQVHVPSASVGRGMRALLTAPINHACLSYHDSAATSPVTKNRPGLYHLCIANCFCPLM